MNCVRLVPSDAQLSNFHIYFLIYCTFSFRTSLMSIVFCGHSSFGIRDGERHFFLWKWQVIMQSNRILLFTYLLGRCRWAHKQHIFEWRHRTWFKGKWIVVTPALKPPCFIVVFFISMLSNLDNSLVVFPIIINFKQIFMSLDINYWS